jgi:hypothetical protein
MEDMDETLLQSLFHRQDAQTSVLAQLVKWIRQACNIDRYRLWRGHVQNWSGQIFYDLKCLSSDTFWDI